MDLGDAVVDAMEPKLKLLTGTVTGTAVGGKVVVSVAGASMTLPKLKSYTPTVPEPVLILVADEWIVLGSAATT